MSIDFSRKYDFPPEFTIGNSGILEIVDDLRLLGVYISRDLRWNKNCDYIIKKANSKLWML